MTKDEFLHLAATNGLRVLSEEALSNGLGVKINLEDGMIACIYNSGKVVPQGKNQDKLKIILGVVPGSAPATVAAQPIASRTVFVVYGHDEDAKRDLEAMLRRWGLEPQILDQLTSGGQTIIEKLESVRREANYAVVLATPDDEGHRAGHDEEKSFRARQNVVLELGMMLAHMGRDKVAVLIKDQSNMERPSDIQGLIYIPFKDSLDEAKLALAKEINAAGITIDLSRV